ncbi:hypothetical protein [Methylobacterium oryzae]|uniref:ABC transporter ATP-binding protein n=1 Tax=Methylobacterium oryzae TaxID=334852 RepID=A0ABU7TSJ8_9HYPH
MRAQPPGPQLIASNPAFGLDFVACRETHARIVEARDAGAGVLLISEDLDELLELAEQVAVTSDGRNVHEGLAERAVRSEFGRYMASG